jgi:benzodiazapine receptor
MNRYLTAILSVLFYGSVSFLGRAFTSYGIPDWYQTLMKPSFTPPGYVIGIIWTVIYILTAISLFLFIIAGKGKPFYTIIIGFYIVNGVINAAWSYIFFTKQLLGPAVLDAALIGITVAVMIALTWRYSKAASLLLIPYLCWVSFATYLSYTIYRMN